MGVKRAHAQLPVVETDNERLSVPETSLTVGVLSDDLVTRIVDGFITL
jgi:hypothetical protein